MVVRLESLRVTADMDVGNYVRAAQQKNAADAQMVASVKAVGQALAAADAATAKAVPGMVSLSRTLITGYGEAAKFESAVRSVGRALDKGMDPARAALQLDGLYKKFGQVADATALTSAGFVKLAPLVSAMNAQYDEMARKANAAAEAQATLASRTAAAQATAARAQTFQGALNERLGVNAAPATSRGAGGETLAAAYRKEEADMASTREKLLRSYDIVGTAERTHAKNIEDATKLLAHGKIEQHEYTTVIAQSGRVLEDTKKAYDGAYTAQNKFGTGAGLARHELVNFGRQAQDVFVSLASGQSVMTVLIQQGTQIVDIFATSRGTFSGFFSNAVSWAARFATSLAGAVTAAAALGVAALAAGFSFASGQREIERSLTGVARQSGVTLSMVNRMADGYADAAKVSTAAAREIIAAYASTGRMDATGIAGTAALNRDFAAQFGLSGLEAAKQLAGAFADPTKGAMELNKQLGFLDAKTLEYIRTAQAQGRLGEAQRAMSDALAESVKGAADRTGLLAQAWNAVWNATSKAWDGIGKAMSGQVAMEERLNELIAKRKDMNRGMGFALSTPMIRNDMDIRIQQQQDAIARRDQRERYEAQQARDRRASTEALSVVDELNPFGGEQRKLETMLATLEKARNVGKDMFNPAQAEAVAEAAERVRKALAESLTPVQRQQKVNELTLQSINARSVADRASVEVDRIKLDTAFKLKSEAEQLLIIAGKTAEVYAQANREARDSLRSAADQAELAGLRSSERREREIQFRERDNRERWGTGATGAQLTAGSPAADGTPSIAMPATAGVFRGLDVAFAANLRRAMQDIPGLTLTQGMRTREQQEDVYRRKPGLAARPGTSNHEMLGGGPARAADLAYNNSGNVPPEIRARLERDYGIHFPLANRAVRPEPWHAEPVGGRAGGLRATMTGQDAAASQAAIERSTAATETWVNVIRNANDNIREQEGALKIQTMAVTSSAYETGRAEKAQELYNQLAASGTKVTTELAAAIEDTAQRYGRLREAAASVKLTQDVNFEREQFGRTAGEGAIASKLRGTGIGMESEIANQMRFNQALGETKSLAGDAMKGFISDLRQGKSAMEGLRGVLDKFASKLFDLATDQLISGLFKGLLGGGGSSGGGGLLGGLFGGGGGGGLLGGLFGGGGGSISPIASSTSIGFAKGGVFSNSIVNRPTQFRFADGGAVGNGLMGEAGPEAIMPLRRNSRGQLGVVTADGGTGGGEAPISISIDARGATVDAVAALRSQIPAIAVRAVQEARKNRVAGI